MATTNNLSDSQIKFLYREAGLPEPDIAWVRNNLPTTENELKNVLSTQAARITGGESASNSGEIDPLKIAQALGYTAEDFANDPGFAAYWKGKSKAELEEKLKARGDFDAISGRKRTQAEDDGRNTFKEDLDARLAAGEIDQSMYDTIMYAYDNTDINKTYTEEEIKDLTDQAQISATNDVKDYYSDVQKRGMEDLRDNYADIRNDALRYQQQNEKSYAETLAEAKKNIRARGLTFSGASRQILGKEGALDNAGIEGSLPQQRRMNWEDARASWQEQARDIGKNAEREYGSKGLYEERDYLNPEGLPDPYDNSSGDAFPDYKPGALAPVYNPKKEGQDGYVKQSAADIEKRRKADIEARKQAIMNTYQQQ